MLSRDVSSDWGVRGGPSERRRWGRLPASSRRAQFRQITKDGVRGKTVVIVGGARGLGLDLTRAFAAKGCQGALLACDEDEMGRAGGGRRVARAQRPRPCRRLTSTLRRTGGDCRRRANASRLNR